jgi:glycine betaine/proline transport system permease protein
MMGLNQTIMMALALVVLATFIGAGGLGYEVWVGIRRLKFGQALEGGIAILLMAIVFDRITTAMSLHQQGNTNKPPGTFRLLPSRFEGHSWAVLIENCLDLIYQLFSLVSGTYTKAIARVIKSLASLGSQSLGNRFYRRVLDHTFFISGLTLLVVLYLIDVYISSFGTFPSSLEFSIRKPSDAALSAMTTSTVFIAITTWIRWFVFTWMLDPLADFLVALPWWYVIVLLSLAVWLSCNRGTAVVCVIGLLFIGAAGIWSIGMFSMAQILVSLLLCMVIGIPIGILAGISNTFEAIIRPILDAMQTLPAFVYLVPVLMFFGGNVVSAVIAIVIYSLAPIIRLTNLGIRGVSSEAIEASLSFGSTFRQTLVKVRIPLALPSIMMGVNQSVMMMLAMLIITPLIGGGGLGREVFLGLSQSDTGWSLQAGLGIVFFAVVLDRLTQSWSTRRQQALGLDVSA